MAILWSLASSGPVRGHLGKPRATGRTFDPEDFERFGRFVLERLIDEMAHREVPDACVARTDLHPEYRAFHLRSRLPGEQERYYGHHLYKAFYRDP